MLRERHAVRIPVQLALQRADDRGVHPIARGGRVATARDAFDAAGEPVGEVEDDRHRLRAPDSDQGTDW